MNDALNLQNDDFSDSLAAPPVRPRRRWLTILLVFVIFAGGVVVGSGATIVIVIRNIQYAIKNPSVVPERATIRLKGMLDLDEQQTTDVRDVLFRLQKRLQAIRGRVYPDVQRELQDARREISAVLDQQQQATWDKIFERVRDRWFPPPPPGSAPAAAAAQ